MRIKRHVIPLTVQEAVLILRPEISAEHRFLSNTRRRVEDSIAKLGGKAFFRLSTKSPKDAWLFDPSLQDCLGIDPSIDDIATRDKKYVKQLSMLCIHTFEDAIRLIRNSDRCKHDIQFFVQHAQPSKIELLFSTWDDVLVSQAIYRELRCFVRHGSLIASCPCLQALFVDHDHDGAIFRTVDMDALRAFIKALSPDPDICVDDSFVADVFVESPTSFRLVEFNEFDSDTDPVAFTWKQLLSM